MKPGGEVRLAADKCQLALSAAAVVVTCRARVCVVMLDGEVLGPQHC
jgi:hypothetical protein